jgi:Flp pilus assembly protein CpaB
MWGRNGSADKQYLNPNRLADVLALIQVLALDEHVHRSEDGLQSELQGQPKSGRSWTEIARSHPEFFRVRPQGDHTVSLIARHVLPKKDQGVRELPSEFAGQLIATAVDLHDRQIKRSERWTYLVPIWVALITGLFVLGAVALKGAFGQN